MDGIRVLLLKAPADVTRAVSPCEGAVTVGVVPVEVTAGGRDAPDVVGWSLPAGGVRVVGWSDEVTPTCPTAGLGVSDRLWDPMMGRESNVDDTAPVGHEVPSNGSCFTQQPE